MNSLKDFLVDNINHIEPFRDIPYLALKKNDAGDVIGSAQASKGQVVVKIIANDEVEGLDHPALLGNLQYLKNLLNNVYTKNEETEIKVHTRESASGDMISISSLDIMAGKLSASYQAVDPFVGNLMKTKVPLIREWPIEFDMTKDMYEDFKSISRIHAATPRTGGDRDDVFLLSVEGENVSLTFGERHHKTSIHLCETLKNTKGNMESLFDIALMDCLFKLGVEGGKLFLTENAIRMDISNEFAVYTYIISKKKMK